MARSAFNEHSSISSSPPMFLEDINEDESWRDFCEEVFHALSYPSSALSLYNKGAKNLVSLISVIDRGIRWPYTSMKLACVLSMEEVRSQSSRATRRVRDAVRFHRTDYFGENTNAIVSIVTLSTPFHCTAWDV